ncbi:MAG: hypothetical protein KDA84_01635, partial [Planctomycetaceae bacterium]|nr:hypothetical protein [Planctomycetaceae bacterium]
MKVFTAASLLFFLSIVAPIVCQAEGWFASRHEPDQIFSSGQSERELEPIETDRHDFTQSPRTVGAGVVQFEGGYSYFYKDQKEEI